MTSVSALNPKLFWKQVRAYYGGSKDRLIAGCISKAIDRARATTPEIIVYFDRHWTGGPHVRLYVGAEDMTRCARWANSFADSIRAYVTEHPSQEWLSDRDYLGMHNTLALVEARNAADPLQPNNSVSVWNDDSDAILWGGNRMIDLSRRFFARVSTTLADWLSAVGESSIRKEHVAFRVLCIIAWLAEPEKLGAHLSYRSHAEGFFEWTRKPDTYRAKFERLYQQRRSHVATELRQAVCDTAAGRESYPPMLAYLAGVADLWEKLQLELKAGSIEAPDPDQRASIVFERMSLLVPDVGMLVPVGNWRDKKVQKQLFALGRDNVALQSWVLIINVVYVTLRQLGLAALDRFFLCWLVSRAVEDEYGVTTRELIHRVIATSDTSPFVSFRRAADAPDAARPC